MVEQAELEGKKAGVGIGALVVIAVIAWFWLRRKPAEVEEAKGYIPPIVGVTPASAGYQWDEAKQGWYRPWEPIASFVPRAEKPEWDMFIPEVAPTPPPFDPWSYDLDGDGFIDQSEAGKAMTDYYAGIITKQQASQVTNLVSIPEPPAKSAAEPALGERKWIDGVWQEYCGMGIWAPVSTNLTECKAAGGDYIVNMQCVRGMPSIGVEEIPMITAPTKKETLQKVVDYYAGEATKEEALQAVVDYFG